MSWSFIGLVALLFGGMLGQFGYGTGVLLMLAAAIMWTGGALHLWINASDVSFLIAAFSLTGAVTIATHFAIVLYRKAVKPGSSGEST
jgi:ABC-type spermidine/putrescine transport system permease subunit II